MLPSSAEMVTERSSTATATDRTQPRLEARCHQIRQASWVSTGWIVADLTGHILTLSPRTVRRASRNLPDADSRPTAEASSRTNPSHYKVRRWLDNLACPSEKQHLAAAL